MGLERFSFLGTFTPLIAKSFANGVFCLNLQSKLMQSRTQLNKKLNYKLQGKHMHRNKNNSKDRTMANQMSSLESNLIMGAAYVHHFLYKCKRKYKLHHTWKRTTMLQLRLIHPP